MIPAETQRAIARERTWHPCTWGQSPMDQLDAANECRHGSLPHDERIRCSCWGLKATQTATADQSTVRRVV